VIRVTVVRQVVNQTLRFAQGMAQILAAAAAARAGPKGKKIL
jgi:hypothetical protein